MASGIQWNYTNPEIWPDTFCKNGSRQSPINIITKDAKASSELTALKLEGYGPSEKVSGTVENKHGHTLEFTPLPGEAKALFTNHRGTYELLQFHIHWPDSEHEVDGHHHSAEIHFVHRKVDAPKEYAGVDLYSVLAVFCEEKDSDLEEDSVWDVLVDGWSKDYDEEKESDEEFSYSQLLPTKRDYFYYGGSLTTPNCDEVVQWFVLKDYIDIPTSVISALQELAATPGGKPLVANFRDPQPLNGRVVYSYTELETGAIDASPVIFTLSSFVALSFVLTLLENLFV